MLNTLDIVVNSFAQGKLTLEKLLEWFDSLNKEDQKKALWGAILVLSQTHPDEETINLGIKNIPLKPTMTPIVLLNTKPFKIALDQIILLPENEYKKSFICLISLFKVSDDKRRKTGCKEGCHHDWHNLEKLNISITDNYLVSIKGIIS